MKSAHGEWLHGWDPTPGIVSVWATPNGRAVVWRRISSESGEPLRLVCETEQFRPWVLLSSLADLRHLGAKLQPEKAGHTRGIVTYKELDGPGELRFCVRADDGMFLAAAVLEGASRRLGRGLKNLRELGNEHVLSLPPEEQYLTVTGRNYFRNLTFDNLLRLDFDLETTGLNPDVDRIFLIAVRTPDGDALTLEVNRSAGATENRAEAELIMRFAALVHETDPDVIENPNLHGFDLPFLARRAKHLGVRLCLGRLDNVELRTRPAARGAGRMGQENQVERGAKTRFTMPGRELIDTLDAVLRHDFSARDLPGHGLKAVAKHLGLASQDREYIPGGKIHSTYLTHPERVRRYAKDDVVESAALARILGGSAFALATMAPRRYERLADAGPATGVIDPMIVRAYLREGAALPAHEPGDGTSHTGAALYLFASGVAHRIVKADVASLYPSLMRQYQISPSRDRLGVLLTLVDTLVERRLAAKARARTLPAGSPERHAEEALSAAMKLVVNSAYGYLGAVGLTRFADVHAANEVTRRGRELLDFLCSELKKRGATLLEADTDGVYFSVPQHWTVGDERRVVSEVAALLPDKVHLEFDGRFAAMLSHEPKNYALLPYGKVADSGSEDCCPDVKLRGVAFRSSRAEPFGEEFLKRALSHLLRDNVMGVRKVYCETIDKLRRRELPTEQVAILVRLTKSSSKYAAVRGQRRELPYEALLQNGRTHWTVGDKVRVYRAAGGRAGLLPEPDDDDLSVHIESAPDSRDYDVEAYVRVLRETFAARLARALSPDDYVLTFADPNAPHLFEKSLENARPILTRLDAGDKKMETFTG
ncbi:MAG: ribonuclease H-like domain-containing protein [Polyangiaceae bacterium]|nr:ribonuclease H-like domain-containing protein [Polyangiaceae bacterium]